MGRTRWNTFLKLVLNFSAVFIFNLGLVEIIENSLVTALAQPKITCSKLTMDTLEQGVKYVQS